MKYILKIDETIKKQVDGMTAEQLLEVVLCPHIDPKDDTFTPKGSAAAFLFPSTKDACLDKIGKLNENRINRPLIVSDMEYGAGSVVTGATAFPSMQAAAVAGDEQLAYEMGAIAAKEARAAGFHWTFGPCVDIIYNHNNPIVSFRCAGDTADLNIKYGGAYLRGLQDNGLIATPKHFPGDGCDENDQHLTVAKNTLPFDEWKQTYGAVYQAMIENGARAIMIGHISLPAYDDFDETLGIYPPATLSKKLMTGLLRETLGFRGIIVSDAATMGGFVGCMNPYRAYARFLESGGDCVLFVRPDAGYFKGMLHLLETGELTLATLRDRACRMLSFAKDYFDEFGSLPAPVCDEQAAERTVRKIVDGACVVGRDRTHQLPLTVNKVKKDAKILHAVVVTPEYPKDAPHDMTSTLRRRFDCVDELVDPGPWKLKDLARDGVYDLIVCTVGGQLSFGTNTAKLSGAVARNMMEGWMRYDTPVVFVNFGHPYFMDDYTASVDTVINTYGYTAYTAEAVMNRLFGEDFLFNK